MNLRAAGLPPETMTPRARAYLLIAGTRHLFIGGMCALSPGSFSSVSYDPIKATLPVAPWAAMRIWGVLFLGTFVLCAVAALRGREGIARWALLASVLSSALWAAGFIAGAVEGTLGIPTSPVIWTAVTLKDITMLRAPLRNPFEPIVRKALAESEKT